MMSLRTVNGVKAAPCNKVNDRERSSRTVKSPIKGTRSLSRIKKCKKRHSGERRRTSPRAHEQTSDSVSSQRAPCNYGQYLMEEHDNLSEKDLDNPPRNRESSVSMESDTEDFIVQDEQFLSRQFWSAYNDFAAERLDNMAKSQLIQEFLALEDRIEGLQAQLSDIRQRDLARIREPSPIEGDEDPRLPGEVPVDAETAAKIEVFTAEIEKLYKENKKLRLHNNLLRNGIEVDKSAYEGYETDDDSYASDFSDSSLHSARIFSDDSGLASYDGGISSSGEDFSKDVKM